MKKAINHKILKTALLTLIVLAGSFASAQVLNPFTPRFNETVNGDVTMIANNMVSRTATQDYNGSAGNHDFNNNVYVDIDGLYDVNNDNIDDTFNSSSANFNNPSPLTECLTVYKAYLYWAAADKEPTSDLNSENQPNWNFNDVMLMLPGESQYTTLSADEVIYRGRNFHINNDPYICYKDITGLVENLTNPYGTYQVANVEAKIGSLIGHSDAIIGTSGGWQIVFVYESPQLPSKNISLFDGYSNVTSLENNFDITFGGFQTVPTGNVNTNIVIGSLEGDRDLTGDQLQIQNTNGDFVSIAAPQRTSNNFFSSRITIENSDFLDRNPASQNTLGFDAAVFNLDNPGNTIIDNNQTTATIRLASNQETYGLFLVGLSVDVWAPDLDPIEIIMDAGATPADAGSALGFSFEVINKGNDDALNLSVSTTLPPQIADVNMVNLPTGVTYNFNPTTRLLEFFIADGFVDVGDPALNVNFDVVIQDECYFLVDDCDLSFELQFSANYNGVQNPNNQSTLSSGSLDECGIGNKLPLLIDINQPVLSWTNTVGDLDRAITCSDIDGLNAAQALEPTLDKCNLIPVKTSGIFVADPTCPNKGTYTNTWTFTDACDTTIEEYVQTITVEDTTAPTFTVPADITVECDVDVNDLSITGDVTDEADNCSAGLEATFADTVANGACANESVITRTWTLTDECDNTTTLVQTITVEDTTAPTFTVPADITVECDVDVNDLSITGDVTDEADNCSAGLEATFADTVANGACANESVITRTWTLTDECDNTTTLVQTITVEDNTAPTFTVPADITVECDVDVNDLSITGDVTDEADNCSAGLEATFADTVANGACANESVITRTWTLTDECDNTTTLVQTITVEDNTAPTFTVPADITVECDVDVNDLSITGDVTDEADNCSAGLEATFADTVANGACANESVITRTWTLTDECDNTTTLVQTITVEDTTAPTFTVPADITVECDVDVNDLSITGDVTDEADNCSAGLEATFADTVANGACANESVITRTWTLTDECDNTTTLVQTITVEDTTAPTFTVPADITVECDVDVNDLSITGDVTDEADNCSAGLEATFADTVANGACANESVITRTWTLTDECDNTTTLVQTITVEDNTAPTFTVPADITVECDVDVNDLSITGDVTDEADNCSAGLEATFADTVANGACANESVITRTWTLTDECDNTTTLVQTITVEDNTAPTFTVPADITVECDVDVNDLSITGDVTDEADNCSAGLEATFADTVANGACANESVITRTWTLTDECDNTTTLVQTITVEDNTAPTFTVPADITVECDVDVNDLSITGDVTDEADNCSAGLEATFADTVANGACANESVITRTWTLTDECDNTTTLVQTITVEDNTAPTFTVPADITVECDVDVNDLSITGDVTDEADNCSAGLEATFVDTVANGACANESVITRTWTLTDECDNTTTLVQTITVEDNTAPTFTVPADITVECDVDVNDLSITGDVTDEADNCSAGLEATFADTVANGACANESVITRTWTLTDECDNTTTLVQTITVEDNTAPIIICPTDIIVSADLGQPSADVTISLPTISDNCNGDITYSNDYTNTEDASGTYNLGTTTVTYTATDACGNTSECTFTVTVIENEAPEINCPPTITVSCIDAVPAPYANYNEFVNSGGSASDSSSIDETSFELVSETSDGNSCPETISRIYRISDDEGNFSECTQLIIVNDELDPVLVVPADEIVECGAIPELGTPTATDNCDSDVDIVYDGEVRTDGLCNNTYTLTRTWTATDDCGNTHTVSQTITVEDTTAPTFTVPADITVECDVDVNDLSITGDVTDEADNCSTGLEATFADTVANGACANESVITRTWTLTDECDNTTTLVQTITVEDNTAPTFTVPADITVECDVDVNDLNITGDVTDEADCSTGLEATFADTVANGACANESVITRTWTLTDECDNTTTLVQTITVEDNTAPVFNEDLPSDVTVECNNVPEAPTITANDNCDSSIEVVFEEEITEGSCIGEYLIIRTWIATDSCNNQSSHSQIISVEDLTPPTLVTPFDENITIVCDDVPAPPNLVFQDACSNNIGVEFNEVSTQTNDLEDYEVIRTWTVTDDCGNVSVFTQNITVELSNVINASDSNRCILDEEFDLFDLLSGDFDMNGTWSVVAGDATLNNGSFFDPATVDIGVYTFMYAITDGPCPNEVQLNVTIDDDCVVLACGLEDVVVSKTVTANGDDINDFFTVSGIEDCGFVIELQIFNRWGAKIYQSNNYQNDWNGFTNSSSFGSSGAVPTGTYYYVINLRNSGLEPIVGPIYVATNK